MAEQAEKYAAIHYHDYLKLDQVLDAQQLRSARIDAAPAHDEMLFIIIHQVYELWFKQIIHELTSVAAMFSGGHVDERNIGVAVARLNRVIEIQKLLIQQVQVLETMTPLDFLDFRAYLFPASGFQSYQFRVVEVLLGLRESERLTYNNQPYYTVFDEIRRRELERLQAKPSMFELVQDWLERTPFLQYADFDFLEKYKSAVTDMLSREAEAIRHSDYLSDADKAGRLAMLGGTETFFKNVLDQAAHEEALQSGQMRLSYRATLAALFINLYRDEPILHMPYRLLTCLVEIDEHFTTWRYRHAQMVLRMLGRKIGTGGSSGHKYLHDTAVRHHIFTDFHHISTLLIPRSELPVLPPQVKRQLGFYYGTGQD